MLSRQTLSSAKRVYYSASWSDGWLSIGGYHNVVKHTTQVTAFYFGHDLLSSSSFTGVYRGQKICFCFVSRAQNKGGVKESSIMSPLLNYLHGSHLQVCM